MGVGLSNNDKDGKDLIGDLVIVESDSYLTNKVIDKSAKQANPSQVPDAINGEDDPTSEFLNISELVSLSEFPAVKSVPDSYVPTKDKDPVKKTKKYATVKGKNWTQRKSYEVFMGCLDWLRADPAHLFQVEYWTLVGIAERQVYSLAKRYPICRYVQEQIHQAQEAKLLNGAVHEDLHPGFVKFYLNCRYQDKYIPRTETKQEVSGQINNAQVQVVFEEVRTSENKSITETKAIP